MNTNGQYPDHQPNTLHWHRGDDGCHHGFGDFYDVRAIFPFGSGHAPYLQIRSTHGLRLDVTEEFLTALVRQAPAQIAHLHHPHGLPAIHDAVGGVEEWARENRTGGYLDGQPIIAAVSKQDAVDE